MRRPPDFFLHLLVFAFLLALSGALLTGCGGGTESADPAKVVEHWSTSINGGDDEAAAALYAANAVVVQGGHRKTLAGRSAALAFNSSLPCGYRVVAQRVTGNETTATFTRTHRPGHMCDGTGRSAAVRFEIANGKITLWHQLDRVDG